VSDVEQLLRRLLQQEDALQFAEFSNDMAYELGVRLVAGARREGKSITIDISRNGQQLFHCALPGTSADNDEWIKRKNRVVNRFGHSSFYLGRYYANQGTTLEERMYLDPAEYAAHGGAFPILIKGVGVVGTITVSGLPQQEDHEFVVRTLAEYLGASLPE
jgi:uncharacterized protein (UPF0303 family)